MNGVEVDVFHWRGLARQLAFVEVRHVEIIRVEQVEDVEAGMANGKCAPPNCPSAACGDPAGAIHRRHMGAMQNSGTSGARGGPSR